MSTIWIRDEAGELVREEKKSRKKAKEPKPEPLPEQEELREVGASMSKTDLLLNCQWWVERLLPKDIKSFPARYGSAFHEALAVKLLVPPKKIKIVHIAEKWNPEGETELVDHAELRRHVKISHEYLIDWLKGENPWKVNFVKRAQARTEQAFAWNVAKKTARACALPTTDTHEYKVKPGEFPGTADLVIDKINTKKDAPDLIVIDHKTGESCDLPKHSMQLRSLMLTAGKRMGAKRVAGGIFHTPREGAPYLYMDEFSREEHTAHANRLQVAWQGIGAGALRPGDWCQYCPAFTVCPVHTSAIGQLETVQRGAMTEEKIGRAHEIISRFTAWAGQYKETVIRPWVVKHGPTPRPDGKLVTLRKKTVRNLSLSSVERALGKVAGQRRIEELTKEGLVESVEREELVAVNDK